MLEMSGFRVVMIRDSDVSVGDNTLDTVKARKTSDMHNRLKIIEENGDCVFLSIHQNHFTNGKYSGAQIFYGTKNPKSQALLRNADVPAVIVECGFLSNAGEAKKLSQPEYQKQMAFAIYQGFLSYWISVSQTMA